MAVLIIVLGAAAQGCCAQPPRPMSRKRTFTPPPSEAEQAESGRLLLEDLQQLFCTGRLCAKTFCDLAYHASRAGAVGPVNQWGFAPGKSTGHYNRHIEAKIRASGIDIIEPMLLDVPCQFRKTRNRSVLSVPCRPYHDMLVSELKKPLTRFTVQAQLREQNWPPVFTEHEVVKAAGPGELVVPLAIYVDGAQYGGAAGAGRSKTVLNVSMINLCTQRRHVGIVFRKHVACKCGCKGYCSYSRLFQFLRWSVDALASGTYPSLDWDGKEICGADQLAVAGKTVGFKGAVCYVMADWEALSQHFSVPSWKSKFHCCPLCDTTLENMHCYRTAFFRTGG